MRPREMFPRMPGRLSVCGGVRGAIQDLPPLLYLRTDGCWHQDPPGSAGQAGGNYSARVYWDRLHERDDATRVRCGTGGYPLVHRWIGFPHPETGDSTGSPTSLPETRSNTMTTQHRVAQYLATPPTQRHTRPAPETVAARPPSRPALSRPLASHAIPAPVGRIRNRQNGLGWNSAESPFRYSQEKPSRNLTRTLPRTKRS